MPKQRITGELLLDAAFELVRADGYERLSVQRVAAAAGCSVQPVYSYFKNMEALREDLFLRADAFYRSFVAAQLEEDPSFRARGWAQVLFARQEPQLFRLLFLSDLRRHRDLAALYRERADPAAARAAAAQTGLPPAAARRLHLQMLVYTQGLCSMLVSGAVEISDQEARRMMDDAFAALCAQAVPMEETR
ncbi:TetR/AcrR family transcriptional regulator [Anaerofilum sp. BX8]|uniref:TetR/AcrR family transcriptional regulator n=1 Tax=Anaerofilum hominis TaxID=2763016 RepID=A0A923I774_9FIRM|nr:TetR/AcrR family transcriptional regulator [Anaerofilum hominis]MBC5580409.1 TetR/AcrR family transcriptional regulator [Anaerofilum hominis]